MPKVPHLVSKGVQIQTQVSAATVLPRECGLVPSLPTKAAEGAAYGGLLPLQRAALQEAGRVQALLGSGAWGLEWCFGAQAPGHSLPALLLGPL